MNVLLQLKINIFVPSKHEYKTSFDAIRQKKTCFFVVFCVQLVSQHHYMHSPISKLHAQWH
jgi:hypothetical protein